MCLTISASTHLAEIECGRGYMCLNWRAPTHNVDGSVIQPGELSHFTAYWGYNSRDYFDSYLIGNPDDVGAIIPMSPGTYRVAMTATNVFSEESAYSNEIEKTILGLILSPPAAGQIIDITCQATITCRFILL